MWLQPEKMMQACLFKADGLSVLYNHAKNTGNSSLKESADGRMRKGMTEVLSKLLDEGFQSMSYGKLVQNIKQNTGKVIRKDLLSLLP